jgi:hypothetical protein
LLLGKTTVTVALAVAEEAVAVAVTVMVLGEGNEDGALYSPLPSMVPVVVLPPCTPFTLHVADVAKELLVAVN